MRQEILIEGRVCRLFGKAAAPKRLIWMADQNESAEEGYELISRLAGDRPFLLTSVPVHDWFRELSPWPAPPVFGGKAFGSGAADTLDFLLRCVLPVMNDIGGIPDHTFLGGYSLAGLFALWAGYESGAFAGVAGVSPSVWFPGWEDYTARRTPKAHAVYLSLGDREERTRNPVMARVGDCIRRQRQALESQGVPSILEWNEGNHFREPETRMAKGFAWLMNQGS